MKELIIPEYEASDFLSSTAPYEFLYGFQDNPFLLAQVREKLKAQAEALGIRGFIGLWKAYLETTAKKNGITLDNVTDFDGQEMELVSGEYICDGYGVSYTDKFGFEQVVCSHPIMPVKRLVNIDTGEEKLEIAYKKGASWRKIIVEKNVISNQSKIIDLAKYGIMVDSQSAKHLGRYLMQLEQLNYASIPEQQSVGRVGWISDDCFSPYVGGLVFDGDESFRHIFSAIGSAGDYEEWVKAMIDLRRGNIFGKLFLAASFASVLVQPCGLLPFFVHAWGGTECGKTVGLMIAASVWANPKPGEYISTFNSTAVAQEFLAGFLNSLPPCLDELQIQSSSGIKDFDRLIYQLAEGVGKSRGNKTGGLLKNKTWRNCIITNGEHPISNLNSGAGAINRVIEFECTEKIYHDLPHLCQIIQQNYGFAGQVFVDYIQTDEGMAKVKEYQKSFYKKLLASNSTDKQAASASAILAADKLVTELIFNDGNNLTVADMQTVLTDRDTVNSNLRAEEYIFELVARNPNKFTTNNFGEYSSEVWGVIDCDCIYIIKSVFDREMKAAGFNAQAYLSWANRTGKIIADKDGNRNTKRKRIPGAGNVHCVCIIKPEESEETDFEEIDSDLIDKF